MKNCVSTDPTGKESAYCSAAIKVATEIHVECRKNQCSILTGRCKTSEIDELDEDHTDILNDECRKIYGIDSELCNAKTDKEHDERKKRECYENYGAGAPECQAKEEKKEEPESNSDIKVCRLDLGEFGCGPEGDPAEDDGGGSGDGGSGGEGTGGGGGSGGSSGSGSGGGSSGGGGAGGGGSSGGGSGGGSSGGGGESPPGPPSPPTPPGPPGPPNPPGPPGPPTPPGPPGPFGGYDGGGAGICLGRWCASGDPHLVSADGVRYDFQAVGEFIFAKSENLDTELQVRTSPYGMVFKPQLEPYGSARYLSVITALAFRANGATLTVDVIRPKGERIQINGDVVNFALGEEGVIKHATGFTIYHHTNDVYEIWTPQNVRLKFATRSAHINLDIAFPFYKSAGVTGLLGGRDGNPANDFMTRDGVLIPHDRGRLSREDLYDRFGNSWRITQEESLFTYADGESTDTYTNLALPEKVVTLADLSPEKRAEAERICKDAGLTEGPVLNDCIYDVGFSGDEEFARAYADTAIIDPEVNFDVPANDQSEATLNAPELVVAGASFEVDWTGPANNRDYIALANPGAEKGSDYLRYGFVAANGDPVALTAPSTPGVYELRYVLNNDRRIIARRELTVTETAATLAAPDKVEAGSTFEIQWTGPANNRDYIALANPGEPDGYRYLRYTFVSESGNAASIQAPGTPGVYELRYVLNSDRRIVARREITVIETNATLNAPETVNAGATFDVEWTGPANNRDYITLANPEETDGSRYITYDFVTQDSRPINLKAPTEPGRYELRYVLSSDRVIIARRLIYVQ